MPGARAGLRDSVPLTLGPIEKPSVHAIRARGPGTFPP